MMVVLYPPITHPAPSRKDNRLHGGQLGQITMAFGIGESQEFFQLFIRPERVGGELAQDAG
jgi:hypothetical protein